MQGPPQPFMSSRSWRQAEAFTHHGRRPGLDPPLLVAVRRLRPGGRSMRDCLGTPRFLARACPFSVPVVIPGPVESAFRRLARRCAMQPPQVAAAEAREVPS
jgi:hypothetical protein